MSVPLLVLVYTRGGSVYIVIPEHRHTIVDHALGELCTRRRRGFTWSKAPLANLLISWVLPHCESPTTTTDTPDILNEMVSLLFV